MWEIEYNKNKDKEYKIACTKCDGETYHKVIHSVHVHESENDIDVWNDYEIVSCQGCKEISFRSNFVCSEDINYDPETGEQYLDENIELYPNRIAGRKQVKDMYLLPPKVQAIYKETHGALCARLHILASAGIRALVESVCVEKEAEGRNLERKIDDLVSKGILTHVSATTLHNTRLLGNRSIHELAPASYEELDIAMDIVENLVKNVYVIPEKAKRLE